MSSLHRNLLVILNLGQSSAWPPFVWRSRLSATFVSPHVSVRPAQQSHAFLFLVRLIWIVFDPLMSFAMLNQVVTQMLMTGHMPFTHATSLLICLVRS